MSIAIVTSVILTDELGMGMGSLAAGSVEALVAGGDLFGFWELMISGACET